MRTKVHLVLSLTILMSCFSVFGQNGYWKQTAQPNDKMPSHLQHLDTKKVEYYSLDRVGLQNILQRLNSRNAKETIVHFPDSKGKLVAFRIKEAPVFSGPLTSKYPEIRSYKGYSQDGNDRIRISMSPKGVQTMIVHTEKGLNTYMDKASGADTYVVYQKSADLSAGKSFVCRTPITEPEKGSGASVARLVDDQLLRKYRIAVSTTGEYSQYHGGSTINALAAINATLTRVNEVFETDLGISLELIPNNDLVIYSNPATDPYEGNLNTEVQATLSSEIGEANYDVGHLFHMDIDNGNAGFIGSVCQDGKKGSAFSSAMEPEGDRYDLDYVSHELGHQFGANHTWSFETEGTLVQAEPASGTTIMGYAGIVQGNNVEPNGDDYYHYNSILQITEYIATQSCAQEMSIANNPPVLSPLSDYMIPRSTAFVLEGSATDADAGDVLTYGWEQIDNGVVTTTTFGPDNPTGANFRSLRPTTSPRRYFPKLSEVAQGNLTQTNPAESSAWETVSDIEREMNFALTVRDNADGGGQVVTDVLKVDVLAGAGPFAITSQASQETLTAGSPMTISWDVAGTNINPINAQMVDIFLSTDGGLSFPTALVSGTPNDGNEEILLPGTSSVTARVMVKASDNIFFAINSSDFTIEEAEIVLQFDQLDYEVCQPNDLVVPFTYETFGGFSETATFSTSGLPAGMTAVFNPVSASANDTAVDITFSGTDMVSPGLYPVTVIATAASASKQIDLNINVLATGFGSLVLSNPSNGAVDVGMGELLNWETDPLATSYDLEIATDMAFTNIVETATVLFNSYSPGMLMEETTYYWRVKPVNICGEGSFSAPFSFTTIGINCKTVAATGMPIEISSSGTPTITSTITIIDDLPIADINVTLDISHTFVSDLVITLESPAGTRVVLVSNSCGQFMDIDAVFDNDAPSFVCGNNPAISGTVKPLGSLAAFNGESPVGVWVLTVDDVANADGGSLNVFDLEICVEGNFKPDTDGDGVFDENDLCPGTPPGQEVDVVGCEVYRFAADNFTVSVESEACIGSNDGEIVIAAQTSMDYTIGITGPGTNVTDSFTTTYTANNLQGGTYTICINGTDAGNVFEEVCFDVIAEEPAPLGVSSLLSADGSQVVLSLSGSDLYSIELNGDLIQTSDSEITLDLKGGSNALKVSTLQDCQGSFAEEYFYSLSPVVYPNPFAVATFVTLVGNEGEVQITVHSSDGRLLMSKKELATEVEAPLDFTGLPSGMYFVRVENGQMKRTYKVIKR